MHTARKLSRYALDGKEGDREKNERNSGGSAQDSAEPPPTLSARLRSRSRRHRNPFHAVCRLGRGDPPPKHRAARPFSRAIVQPRRAPSCPSTLARTPVLSRRRSVLDVSRYFCLRWKRPKFQPVRWAMDYHSVHGHDISSFDLPLPRKSRNPPSARCVHGAACPRFY